jgi:hypothetical protein
MVIKDTEIRRNGDPEKIDMGKKRLTSEGRQTFKEIIELNRIYVDKTAQLAMMIEGSPKTWFLTRPRRFGKSLTVSTLEAIFSGEKELFKGLAIENKLDEELFAPRPVIHLDMSQIDTSSGLEDFDLALRDRTVNKAKEHGIELSMNLPASSLFINLVEGCAKKYGGQVAILIDEYDAPISDLLGSPDDLDDVSQKLLEAVRQKLRVYYRQIKSVDKYISFVFITGITKYVGQDFNSTFNNPTVISMDPLYGTLTGFTHEEVMSYYKWQIQEVAEYQKMTVDNLLAKMNDYYDGFCFDGEHYVYNPFSMLQFFGAKEFDNFWFDTGSSEQLVKYFRKNRLTVEKFRGISVSRARVKSPSSDGIQLPHLFLYQYGYLSLRPSQEPGEFKLDYPNVEVLESMSRRVLESFFNFSPQIDIVCANLRKAAKNRDPAALVAEINEALSNLPYEDFKDKSLDESFYRSHMLTLFHAAGLAPRAELHGNLGRSDLAFNYSDQNWVLEIKLNRDAKTSDESLAKVALKQILDNNYGGSFVNPFLLGLVVNFERRLITAWESQDGILKGAARKIYSIDDQPIDDQPIDDHPKPNPSANGS